MGYPVETEMMIKILENDSHVEGYRVIFNHSEVHPGYRAVTEVWHRRAARTLEI